MKNLTIINYHYVRNPEERGFPGLKAIRVDTFCKQLDMLAQDFNIIGWDSLVGALQGTQDLVSNAALLTFDDGYIEHFDTVLPELDKRGISGMFFVPAASSRDGRVLVVNKIQMLLSQCSDVMVLVDHIDDAVQALQDESNVETIEEYRARYFKPSRYDPPETQYVKKMLQVGLPEELRFTIVDNLFAKFVSDDERRIAAEFYAQPDQLRQMIADGHYIGPHGVHHNWMNHLPIERMNDEISESLSFMDSIGAPTENWVACYPYGGHSEDLIAANKSHGALCGVTVEARIADLDNDDPMKLPRFDTNDFPVTD